MKNYALTPLFVILALPILSTQCKKRGSQMGSHIKYEKSCIPGNPSAPVIVSDTLKGDTNYVVVASAGVTFHSKELAIDYGATLENLYKKVGIGEPQVVKHNDVDHDYFHTAKPQDADFPERHFHIRGDIDSDEIFQNQIKYLMDNMLSHGLLTAEDINEVNLVINAFQDL